MQIDEKALIACNPTYQRARPFLPSNPNVPASTPIDFEAHPLYFHHTLFRLSQHFSLIAATHASIAMRKRASPLVRTA